MVDRLREDLIEAGMIGRTSAKRIQRREQLDSKDGITRPTGSEANRLIRDYAADRMKKAGLVVRTDKVGNIFARREGSKTEKGTVMTGSHLDSVINGGMFDGALGVFGAIEAVRRMTDEGFKNERALEVAVFTGEEGSAFGSVLLGSSALVGSVNYDEVLGRKTVLGKTLSVALGDLGYKGDFERGLDDVVYFIELHVEQGPVLYREKIPIGIVEHISGVTWITATIIGEENHAGTTPMSMRKDALLAASEVIAFVSNHANKISERSGGSMVATVGKLNIFPNGTNVIPGMVEMGIDIRDVVNGNMTELRDAIVEVLQGLESRYGVSVDIQIPVTHAPTPLSAEIIDIIQNSAHRLGINTKKMNSGAVHDSQNMAQKVKTGMIFVPSVRGVSHSPMEWTDWKDIETGVRVLTQTLKNLSKLEEDN